MDTMKAASRLTLLVIILAVITRPVLSDSCTTDGLQGDKGAAASDQDTFGCRNTFCVHGSPEYHIILHGNNWGQRGQRVEVNLQRACDGTRDRYDDTILVLMSGYPVTWVLTGFTSSVGHVFLVGGGTVLQDSGEIEFEQSEIYVDNKNHQYLRRNNEPPSGAAINAFINTLLENNYVSKSGWPFNHEAASVNFAWMATSWKLTVGENCCLTTPEPTKPVTRTMPSTSTTVPWWRRSTTTTITDITPPEPSSSQAEVSGSASRQGIAGIAAGIGAILVVVILTIVITIVCWCCCRKGKRASKGTTSQTNQLNTVQGLQTIESGATQEAEPNVYTQSHPTPFNYPTGGPQPSTGLVGHPEPPPPYNDGHPIQPPSYSQVIREHNGRVEPTAPPLHI